MTAKERIDNWDGAISFAAIAATWTLHRQLVRYFAPHAEGAGEQQVRKSFVDESATSAKAIWLDEDKQQGRRKTASK